MKIYLSPNVVEKRKNGQNYKLFRKKTSGTQVLTISFCKYVGIGNNYGHFYFRNYKEKRYFLLTLLTNISCPYTLKKVESRMAKESLGQILFITDTICLRSPENQERSSSREIVDRVCVQDDH